MRQPRTPFTTVDAEGLEPFLNVTGQCARVTGGIAEDEHRDAPRLAIPIDVELEGVALADGLLERGKDLRELGCRASAEECERDVEMLPRDDAAGASKRTLLPGDNAGPHRLGKPQSEEESKPLIALQATRRAHTS